MLKKKNLFLSPVKTKGITALGCRKLKFPYGGIFKIFRIELNRIFQLKGSCKELFSLMTSGLTKG